jgi:hypothetical protein
MASQASLDQAKDVYHSGEAATMELPDYPTSFQASPEFERVRFDQASHSARFASGISRMNGWSTRCHSVCKRAPRIHTSHFP